MNICAVGVDFRCYMIWTASSEFGTYRLCEQRRLRRACASAQSRQNLRCSLIQAVSQEDPSDRKPDPLPLWMSGHAQLQFVMTECSKTQIRLTGLIYEKKNRKDKSMIWIKAHELWHHRSVFKSVIFGYYKYSVTCLKILLIIFQTKGRRLCYWETLIKIKMQNEKISQLL